MVDAIIKEMRYIYATINSNFKALNLLVIRSNLLAAYIFAQPPEAKFLAQHLKAHLTVINQIPVNLLVGPAAPCGIAMEYKYRYSPEMFSIPRPQYIHALPTELSVVDEHLVPGRNPNGTTKVKQLRSLATRKLPGTGQSQGHDIGFFEQGILLGLGVVLSIVVPAAGWGLWAVGKKVRSSM